MDSALSAAGPDYKHASKTDADAVKSRVTTRLMSRTRRMAHACGGRVACKGSAAAWW
jgi:hypothetical protein